MLKAPAKWQQLAVVAHVRRRHARDVTRLTVFSSSDPSIADVTPNGLVEFKRPGEVAILCRYLEELVAVRLTYLEPREGFVWPNPPEANYVDTHVVRQAEADEHRRRRSCAPTTSSSAGRTSTASAACRPADEAKAFLADKDAKKRDKLIDALLDTAGVRRLLGAEVGRRAPQQPQDDPGEGQLRVPGVAPRPLR